MHEKVFAFVLWHSFTCALRIFLLHTEDLTEQRCMCMWQLTGAWWKIYLYLDLSQAHLILLTLGYSVRAFPGASETCLSCSHMLPPHHALVLHPRSKQNSIYSTMRIPFALSFSISDLFFWTSGLVAAIYPWAAFVCCAWSNTSTYIEWQVKRKASQREGRVCQIHLPLSSPVCWFSISGSWGRHFLFLAGVLTPLLAPSGPLAEAPCYLLPRELCVQRVNTAWLAEQGSNLLLVLTHASTDAHKHTHTHTSHDHPRGLVEMFTALRSLYPEELRAMDRETNRHRRPQPWQLYPASGFKLLQQKGKCEALGLMMWRSKHPWRLQEVHPDRTWQHSLGWTLKSAGRTWKHVLRCMELCEDIVRVGGLI